jgi:hypothetical protein
VTLQMPTREEIIDAWKRADEEAIAKGDKPLGANEVAAFMNISPYWIWKRFAGHSTTDMKRKNGIRLSPQEIHRDRNELLAIFDATIASRKSIPGWIVLQHDTGIPESS